MIKEILRQKERTIKTIENEKNNYTTSPTIY